jgi:hypothetical protein
MSWEPQNREFGSTASAVLGEESARAFMTSVYSWMVGGLGVTAGTALVVARSQSLVHLVGGLFFPLIIGQLVAVFALSAMAPRLSGAVAAAMFLGYSFLNGLTLSSVFLMYQLGSIGMVFMITATMFGTMSLYGTVTKKDLSAWGTFLFMGLVGIILAGVLNLFIRSDMMTFISSCAGVVIFAGLTAYDTQKLRALHQTSGFASAQALAVTGALVLYLDFINLFLKLLQLFGRRR